MTRLLALSTFLLLFGAGCGDPDAAPQKPADDVVDAAPSADISFGSSGAGASGGGGGSSDGGGGGSTSGGLVDAHSTPDAGASSGATVADTGGGTSGAGTSGGSSGSGAGDVQDSQSAGSDSGGGGAADAEVDTWTIPDIDPTKKLKRVVLAGDSWSTGLIGPLRDAMDARGFKTTALDYATTANAGSQAQGWIQNKHPPKVGGGEDTTKPKMLDALKASLDAKPAADLLVLVIGGNDLNRECANGYGDAGKLIQGLAMDKIQKDIGDLVDTAIIGRPDLQVVIVGYDFFHFDFLKAAGMKLPGLTQKSYNEALVALDQRRRDVADKRTQVYFANNLGLLQHTYGDKIHPPFPIPNPATGHPEYKPGVAPKPGWAPKYDPMPGGFITYPAPLDHMPDGIHPTAAAFSTLIHHVMDQGMQEVMAGGGWPN